jgi:hypothetical protein
MTAKQMAASFGQSFKNAVSTMGTWMLKSFRGLVCEVKDGGWELSKGAVMSWVTFGMLMKMASDGELPAMTLLGLFGLLMGYNGFKLVDLSKSIGAMKK